MLLCLCTTATDCSKHSVESPTDSSIDSVFLVLICCVLCVDGAPPDGVALVNLKLHVRIELFVHSVHLRVELIDSSFLRYVELVYCNCTLYVCSLNVCT